MGSASALGPTNYQLLSCRSACCRTITSDAASAGGSSLRGALLAHDVTILPLAVYTLELLQCDRRLLDMRLEKWHLDWWMDHWEMVFVWLVHIGGHASGGSFAASNRAPVALECLRYWTRLPLPAENRVTYLQADYRLVCSSGLHRAISVVAVIVLAIHSLGPLSLLFWRLRAPLGQIFPLLRAGA